MQKIKKAAGWVAVLLGIIFLNGLTTSWDHKDEQRDVERTPAAYRLHT